MCAQTLGRRGQPPGRAQCRRPALPLPLNVGRSQRGPTETEEGMRVGAGCVSPSASDLQPLSPQCCRVTTLEHACAGGQSMCRDTCPQGRPVQGAGRPGALPRRCARGAGAGSRTTATSRSLSGSLRCDSRPGTCRGASGNRRAALELLGDCGVTSFWALGFPGVFLSDPLSCRWPSSLP